MIRKTPIIFLFLFIININHGQVSFYKGNMEEAKKEAKLKNKKIFIDCYTSWCGPCKMLDKNVFSTQEFSDFLQKEYIALKLDMEKEGIDIGNAYGISSYPTILILDSEGSEITRLVGYRDTKSLIASLVAKQLQASNEKLIQMQKKYKNGEKNYQFLKDYIKILSANQRSIELPFLDFLELYHLSFTKEDKEWIWDIAVYYNSSATNYIFENKNLYSNKNYNEKIELIIKNSAKYCGEKNDKTTYADILEFINIQKFKNSTKLRYIADMNFALYSNNLKEFREKAHILINKYNIILDEFETNEYNKK